MSPGAAPSPRRATYFSLLRQRNLRKRKATRSLGPCASLRAPCGARFKRGHAQTRCAQTSARPDPLEAPLLGADRRGGVWIRIREALSPLHGLNAAILLIAACARIYWASSLNFIKKSIQQLKFHQRCRYPDQATNFNRFRGSFLTVQIGSTFSRSPIHTRRSKEFDDQIKLRRRD